MTNLHLIKLELGKMCRTCLSNENDLKSVFDQCSDLPELQINKMLELCVALDVNENDGLPGMICIQCELRLSNAFHFRELCQKSNTTLRKYIDNPVNFNIKAESDNEEKYEVEILDETLKSEFFAEEHLEQTLLESTNNEELESDNYDNLEPNDRESDNNEELEQNNRDFDNIEEVEPNDSEIDDKPLILRIENQKDESKMIRFATEVIDQAILNSRRKHDKQRECKLCGFISTNGRGLSLHIAHLHKELKDKWCNVCYEEFDDLGAHNKETHTNTRMYVCTFCAKNFSSQGHLTEHIRSHSLDRPYKCDDCNKGFLSARHLKVHSRIHSGEKPFVCSHCGRRFTQKGSLQGHIRTHTGLKPYICETCNKKCTTSSALALHRNKTGHQSFIKLPVDETENTKSLQITIKKEKKKLGKVEFSDNKQPLRSLCTVCGKTFSSASKLRLHMRVHTGETPYKCQYCQKRFSTRGQLVVHVRTHTGEKPHVCHVCGKGFAQTSVLNTHMRLHTGRPEVCQICSQRFCRPAELRLHMRKHTGEKPFLCTECGQAFKQRSHLMEHVKIHSGERPYKCEVCERAFKQSSSLKSHLQIHTGSKPFKCSQCSYACRQPYSLTKHMKQHADDAPQMDRPHVCLICHKTYTTVAMLTSHTAAVHKVVF